MRSALKAEVEAAEPSAAVRDALLEAAANENPLRSALGPAIPPVASGLEEHAVQTLDYNREVVLITPLAHKQLLLLASPLYAVR